MVISDLSCLCHVFLYFTLDLLQFSFDLLPLVVRQFSFLFASLASFFLTFPFTDSIRHLDHELLSRVLVLKRAEKETDDRFWKPIALFLWIKCCSPGIGLIYSQTPQRSFE